MLETVTQAFNEVDASAVNNLPALRSHTIEFDASLTGSILTFFISATNVIGTA
jgi:hypothetical protein